LPRVEYFTGLEQHLLKLGVGSVPGELSFLIYSSFSIN